MNKQKKLIFDTLTKEINEQKDKFAYFLAKKDEYTQEYDLYQKKLVHEVHTQ